MICFLFLQMSRNDLFSIFKWFYVGPMQVEGGWLKEKKSFWNEKQTRNTLREGKRLFEEGKIGKFKGWEGFHCVREGQPLRINWGKSGEKLQVVNHQLTNANTLGVFDTLSDSIRCLNFAKKWFIQYSIQYCSKIQFKGLFKINFFRNIQIKNLGNFWAIFLFDQY